MFNRSCFVSKRCALVLNENEYLLGANGHQPITDVQMGDNVDGLHVEVSVSGES